MEDIEKRLQQAQKRASDAMAAKNLLDSPEGTLLLDYINERVSTLLTKMTASTPLDDRAYLTAHGAVRELQNIHSMLQSKSQQLEPAKEEIDAIRQDTRTRSA